MIDDPDVQPVSVGAGGHRRRLVGWGELQGVGEQVGQDPLQQGGVGHDLWQVIGQLDLHSIGGVAELVDCQRNDFGDARRLWMYAERPGLQAAHVQQVLDEMGEQVQRLIGGSEELLPVALVEDHIGGTKPTNRGLGGSEWCAQIVAHSPQQCGAELVGFGDRDCCGGLFGEALLSQGEGRLNGECLDDALVGRVEGLAFQHQGEGVVDGHLDVSLPWGRAGRGAHAFRDPPSAGVTAFRWWLRCRGVPLEQRDRVQTEGLA